MELFNGRPATAEGREPKEMRVYDLLDSLGIAYQRTDHAPATTMEVCEVIDAALGCHPCVNTSSLKLRTADVFGKYLEAVHHDYRVVKLVGEE